ncbi:DUF3189 family protein [Anaerobranca gottschalkii]|uniref:DUF3189 domain-containing protein n=1 Tax=Anaerobranca gottschalkii DSM 13577 TaxID=1120990 RepID=A0A1H9YE22_9FIRM|nr:DUF3189 family protein [Anaerobranca gottschalkii]SES67210.1 Protein of unknown function [Anaerobranca gottschalkii DSM 13577]
MKIFYYCYGGAHSSVIAAALHLEKISYPLNYQEILDFPYFDLNTPKEKGMPILLGKDVKGNEIYFVGYGKNKEMIVKLLKSFLKIHGVKDEEFLFVNALERINWRVKLGGFLSKALNLKKIGSRFTALGIVLSGPQIKETVENVKELSENKLNLD